MLLGVFAVCCSVVALAISFEREAGADALWTLVVGLSGFAAACLLAGPFLVRLARDLRRLERRAGEISLGNYGDAPSFDRKDEVGELERALNGMAVTLAEREEQIESSRNHLFESGKMIALGTFAAGIAHELGNPIHAMSALVERIDASRAGGPSTAELGGYPVVLQPGSSSWKLESEDGVVMDGSAAEHAREAAKVLSRYCAAVALRSFPEGKSWKEDVKEPALAEFVRSSTVPVINLESATGHPCQALADLMTIREHMKPAGKKFLLAWAPHTKALPSAVPCSAAEIAAGAGMDITIVRPAGYDLPSEAMTRIKSLCAATGRTLSVSDKPEQAYKDAHVVYAKSWGSLNDYGSPPPQDAAFRKKWIVDGEKMRRTAEAIFMHCLPVRRNLVVTDEVLDGPSSFVIDQAENRLHTAKAVLLGLLLPKDARNAVPLGA